jgi:hypothetical protein
MNNLNHNLEFKLTRIKENGITLYIKISTKTVYLEVDIFRKPTSNGTERHLLNNHLWTMSLRHADFCSIECVFFPYHHKNMW